MREQYRPRCWPQIYSAGAGGPACPVGATRAGALRGDGGGAARGVLSMPFDSCSLHLGDEHRWGARLARC
jgi:hypothetical protein